MYVETRISNEPGLENTDLITAINCILTYIHIENNWNILQYYWFYCFLNK